MPRILLIEDDERLAQMVADLLGTAALAVHRVGSIAQADAAILPRHGQGPFDLVILDLMLPDGDGLDWCRRLRAGDGPDAALPVLMLTARGDPMDRVVGLELGADDYLPKPFEPRELLARVRALLRRQETARAGQVRVEILRFGRLEIDVGMREVRLDGAARPLTSHQFELLCAMARHPGRVLSRDFLMDEVKGEPLEAFDRSIDVHIARIRAAIEDNPKQPRRIITVRGAGYVFARMQE